MIGVLQLGKSFGARTLFEGVTLQLNAGSIYGLVGANGSGKTTFLRILTGDEQPSTGELTFPRGARVGVLRQDRFMNDDQRIVDVAMMGDELVWRALDEQARLAEEEHPDPHRLGELDELLRAHDGYGLEARAAQVLVGLGIPEESLKAPLRTLSGGYKLRVQLAQVLVSRPDALFLDEPTNHLDILSIRWLEGFLGTFKGCAVVISHDHRFLNQVATHVLDVDYETITPYVGNYEAFLVQKEATRVRQEAEFARAEKAIAEKLAFVERFRAKATKARQAQSRAKQVERIEIEKPPQTSRRYPSFRFEQRRQSGKDVLTVEGLSKAYGDKRVLEDVHLVIRRGERVAVIGANGLGKSTLLKIATDNLSADAGTVAWGHEAQLGYFAQDHKDQLTRPEQTALDYLWDSCPQESTSFVRGMLGRVLFSGDDVEKKVASLSGGEATRLIFARLMVQKPNVLVLDEPTNHLDLEAIEALTKALEAFEGTLVFVSHDRWFVSRLATRIIELRKDGMRDFAGTYDEWLERQGDDHLSAEVVALRARREKKDGKDVRRTAPPEAAKPPRVDAKKVARRRDEVEARIAVVEARVAAIQALYCEPDFFSRTAPAEIDRLRDEEARLGIEQEQLLREWETLEEALASVARPG